MDTELGPDTAYLLVDLLFAGYAICGLALWGLISTRSDEEWQEHDQQTREEE